MNTLLTKSVAALSLVAVVMFAGTPAVYAATVSEISGNGADSDNAVTVTNTNTSSIVQSNTAVVTNDIHSSADTGDNEAEDNTGGDVTIGTGNALSTVDVSTQLNINRAVDGIATGNGTTAALISGNGADSDNTVTYSNLNTANAFQDNFADVDNHVHADADTGDNDANRNTGGDTTVITGHAQTGVSVDTAANANLLNLGSVAPAQTGGLSDLRIVGNGADSDNSIVATRLNSMTAVQDNTALIDNFVHADANSGDNDAKDNTGGDVRVDTGMAKALVGIDNMANFNVINDVSSIAPSLGAKVSSNGADSDSYITSLQDNVLSIFQGGNEGAGNLFDLNNRVFASPESGDNEANRNTGALVGGVFYGDPVVISGHATSETVVRNAGNANIYGAGVTLPGGMNLDLQFDLGALWALLH